MKALSLFERTRTGILLVFLSLGLTGCEAMFTHVYPKAGAKAQIIARNLGGHVGNVSDTGSMIPTLHGGDKVIFVTDASRDFKVGDIIVVRISNFFAEGDTNLVCHRLVRLNKNGTLQTLGDANTRPDPWVIYPQDVIGVVRYVVIGRSNEVKRADRFRMRSMTDEQVEEISHLGSGPQLSQDKKEAREGPVGASFNGKANPPS